MNKQAEEILRGYTQFEDVNQDDCIRMLPLSIVDAMEEYATKRLKKELEFLCQVSKLADGTDIQYEIQARLSDLK